jgi:hypothetical protein
MDLQICTWEEPGGTGSQQKNSPWLTLKFTTTDVGVSLLDFVSS